MSGGNGGGLVVMGLLMMAGGGGFAFWCAREDKKHKAQALASRSWLSVPGAVVATEVRMKRSGMGRHQRVQYTPLVAYHYTVDGRAYQGTRIHFGMLVFGFEGPANRALAPYPVGAPVQVHYDPANPADSVLEAGVVTGNMRFGVYASIGVAIFGFLLLIAFAR